MPRSGSGTYTLPEAAFVPNTAISSAAVNSDLSDIADALTDSLARDGQGGMTAVLPLANTGFTYSTDPNTGMRRTAADTQAISCGGIDTISISSTGATITGTGSVSGAFSVGGVLSAGGAPVLPIGAVWPWSGSTAPSKWLLMRGQTLLRADYPDLWTFAAAEIALGNLLFTNGNGTTTFTIADPTGRVMAGKEAVSTRLTSTYFGNSTILGTAGPGGAQSQTLGTSNLPPYTPAGTNAASSVTASSNASGLIAGAAISAGGGTLTTLSQTITGTAAAQVFTGTPQGGTSTAFGVVQPTIIFNFIIYAGV